MCVVCCTPVVTCPCELQLPYPYPFNGTFPDVATAQTDLSDFVVSCIAWALDTIYGYTPPDTFTADNSTQNILIISIEYLTLAASNYNSYSAISVSDGTSLSIDFTITCSGSEQLGQAILVDCATGETVMEDSISSASGTLALNSIPEGKYILNLQFSAGGSTPVPISADFTVTADLVMVVNPVVAIWDDSGTPRELEACPKFILNPIVGSPDPFPDEATAQSFIDDWTTNCVAAREQGAPLDTFSATDGGSSLSIDLATPPTNPGGTIGVNAFGSLNLIGGSTFFCAYTASCTGTVVSDSIQFQILDADFNVLSTVSGTFASGSPLSITVPYTGKFYVRFDAGALVGFQTVVLTAHCDFTSDDTLTVNPVQALYDVGAPCPARLDCS